ncbi:MAG: transporter substrate-binding domain-containing protein [Proteobacteria bacterium]|nr:transporter substrate-binding domain-containing protein [Pseudomonadota bacterium]
MRIFTIQGCCLKKWLLAFPLTFLTATIFSAWLPTLIAGDSAKNVAPIPLVLSEKEQLWLREHPVIRIAPDPDFSPLEYFDTYGMYQGIAADYIALLTKKLPLRFEVVHLENWDEVLRQAKNRDVDLLGAAVPTPERLEYLRFTKPFVTFPAVILVRDSREIPPSVSNLEGLRVAVVSNYADHEFMRRSYPKVPLEVVPDITSGLRLVSFGKVDAMILNLASASYFIEKEGITNLRVYKDSGFIYDLSFASRSDWPELTSILDKAIASMTPEEHQAIFSKWIGLKQEPWRPSRENILLSLFLLAGMVLTGVVLWNITLRKEVAARTIDLQKELAERIRAEQEKEELRQKIHRAKKMEALGLLAGGVAHDLNNILSGLVSYPELLLLDLTPDHPMHKPLKTIHDSGLRAAAVVADLLTIARGAATTKEIVNLNTIITEYLRSPEHQDKCCCFPNISITARLEDTLLNTRCSAIHLRKCLMNLIVNAMEAVTQDGAISISTTNLYVDQPLRGYTDIRPGEYILLTVQDNGSGIDPVNIEHIFEPFYSKKVLGRSGTGLGLAVVWSTVQDHDGYINVTSNPTGSIFELYFPACRETSSAEQDKGTHTHLRGNREKILIIDDEPTQRDIAAGMLTALNYQPYSVASGEEALRFLEGNRVDLIILDMIMAPGMNGRETYERIIARQPGQKAIIASGFSETEEVQKAQHLGAGQYVRKPYTIEKLGTAIQKELRS